jgi:hypothetical protein
LLKPLGREEKGKCEGDRHADRNAHHKRYEMGNFITHSCLIVSVAIFKYREHLRKRAKPYLNSAALVALAIAMVKGRGFTRIVDVCALLKMFDVCATWPLLDRVVLHKKDILMKDV